MSRDEVVEYEQDRFGNRYPTLDTLRGAEGQRNRSDPAGEVRITTADTGSATLLYSNPSNVDRAMVYEVWAFNSVGSGDNTFRLVEGDPDGSGGVSNTTRASVPINVSSGSTKREPYRGEPFTRSIGVVSEFEGRIAVGVIAGRKESSERTTQ